MFHKKSNKTIVARPVTFGLVIIYMLEQWSYSHSHNLNFSIVVDGVENKRLQQVWGHLCLATWLLVAVQ
jgi:hypothetical protein